MDTIRITPSGMLVLRAQAHAVLRDETLGSLAGGRRQILQDRPQKSDKFASDRDHGDLRLLPRGEMFVALV